jgi:hypothetical protein
MTVFRRTRSPDLVCLMSPSQCQAHIFGFEGVLGAVSACVQARCMPWLERECRRDFILIVVNVLKTQMASGLPGG